MEWNIHKEENSKMWRSTKMTPNNNQDLFRKITTPIKTHEYLAVVRAWDSTIRNWTEKRKRVQTLCRSKRKTWNFIWSVCDLGLKLKQKWVGLNNKLVSLWLSQMFYALKSDWDDGYPTVLYAGKLVHEVKLKMILQRKNKIKPQNDAKDYFFHHRLSNVKKRGTFYNVEGNCFLIFGILVEW